MSTTPQSAQRQGVLAGLITFLVTMVPTAAIVYGAQSGSIGSVSTSGFGVMAAAVLGLIAVGSGHLVRRSYERRPERRPGDVWTAWFTGFVVMVVGSWFAPFVVLFVFVDSDHALADRAIEVYLVWTLAHVAAAGAAWWLSRDRVADS